MTLLLLIVPFLAGLAAFAAPPRAGQAITAVAGVASFALVLALIPDASRQTPSTSGFIRVDALSVVFLLATSFLYAAVAIYSIGYLRSGLGRWQDRLFMLLAKNAANPTDFYQIPPGRVLEMGTQVSV